MMKERSPYPTLRAQAAALAMTKKSAKTLSATLPGQERKFIEHDEPTYVNH